MTADSHHERTEKTHVARARCGRGAREGSPSDHRTLVPCDIARMKKVRHSSKKRPNKNFATAAAPAAMPVNPKSAATIAIIKKIKAQRTIVSPP